MTPDIETAIQANVPILYVVTSEEDRFVNKLESFCIRKNRKLWIHSISDGLWTIAFSRQNELWPEKKQGERKEQLRDPIALLEYLKSVPPVEGVFLLLDFNETLKDALVRRMLKDIAGKFKRSQNNIIILGPEADMPASIAHVVSLYDFPLPTQEDLLTALASALTALENRRVRVDLEDRDREKLANAGQGLTMEQFETCLAKAVVRSKGKVDTGIIEEILFEKKRIIKQSGLLEFFDTRETMSGVGGLGSLKTWLSRRQLAFSESARAYGLPLPKGILLLGVQGCGKSLTAKACASLWKFPLLRLDMGNLFSGQVGSSEYRARQAIRMAEAISPCVLWIDEIEKAMAGVGSSSYSDGGTAARVFATFATWMQEKTAPVFVIATANTVTSLPPELIRKGRFDEIFFLDLPGLEERKSILKIHLSKRHRNPLDFDLDRLAEACGDFSGAEIEQGIISGLYDAFDESRPLNTQDIMRSFTTQVPLSKTMAEQIEALRTWALQRARLASGDRFDEEREEWRRGHIRQV